MRTRFSYRQAKNIRYSVIGISLILATIAVIITLVVMVYGGALQTSLLAQLKKANAFADISDETPKGGVVFVGDSITEMYDLDKYFEGEGFINRGISSNETAQILERIQTNVIDLQPKAVIYLAGANDIGHRVPQSETIANMSETFHAIFDNVPDVKLIVQSVYPTVRLDSINSHNLTKHRTNLAITQLNREIQSLCAQMSAEEYNIIYVDMYNKLLDKSTGELNIFYSLDGVHISKFGYDIISEELKHFI